MEEYAFAGKGVVDGVAQPGDGVDMVFYTPPSQPQPQLRFAAAPVIPATATVDEMEAIVAAEGAAVMTDEQAARLEAHFREGVNRDGIAL